MNTEEQILIAARKVFIQKGYDGARMQEIANEAGINKALLHYYFRSKDKLFEQIFTESFQLIRPAFQSAVNADTDIQTFLNLFVGAYLQLLKQIPYLPQFVIQELNRDPQRLAGLIGKQKIPIDAIISMIKKEVNKGNILPISAEHLMINTISMIVFPFIAKPIIETVFFNQEQDMYNKFLNERKDHIVTFIMGAITAPKTSDHE
jgi:AcrR family transcriptional regulator